MGVVVGGLGKGTHIRKGAAAWKWHRAVLHFFPMVPVSLVPFPYWSRGTDRLSELEQFGRENMAGCYMLYSRRRSLKVGQMEQRGEKVE